MTAYPVAIQRPGPAYKVWPEPNAHVGVIEHSAEGYEGGLWAQLDGTAQVSWHFTVLKDGRVFQHYALEAACWHAGNHAQNLRYVGVEHEGVKGEPLTVAQLVASVALTRWIGAQCGWAAAREPIAVRTLWEHREVPGASTTCPNGRIPWEGYVPNDANHADDYDIGLTRIRLEDALRLIRDEHTHAGGDPQVLKDIIDNKR